MVDMALCALTVWIAYYLRLGIWVALIERPPIVVILSIGLAIPIFAVAGLYRTVFRHVDNRFFALTALACGCYAICYLTIISAYAFDDIPRTLGLIQPLLLFLAVCASRVLASWLLTSRIVASSELAQRRRALIYGAGSSGRQLVRAMTENREIKVAGFIDDDQSLQGRSMLGQRIYAPSALADLIVSARVDDILLALPSTSRRRRNEIIASLREFPVRVLTLPGLMDLAHGRVKTSDLRELTIEDLLGRDPVDLDPNIVRERVTGQVILVTGAGGSIGSELCRQLAKAHPAKLLLVDSSEYALYAINRDLASFNVERVALLGSVTDPLRMRAILDTWKPTMVFHAAAYKHVPLVEHNPLEGLRNNVFGTMLIAELSIECGVRDFVLVSTDKAVRPTNVMGASKRLSELCLQALAANSRTTCLSMVRFGNVLGSSGSVVPLFREQIRSGGPVTITHREITRYFMTIPEAAQLVVQASTMARGGEVFVLDMGDPVRIYDLARNLVELSGMSVRDDDNPLGDIEITTMGLRPGEKLYEELLIDDNAMPTRHPRIMMASEKFIPLDVLRSKLAFMNESIHNGDVVRTREILCQLVPEYVPETQIVDLVYISRKTD
jgi:FlaA1/EpsC-like NDP-sugar epimerase